MEADDVETRAALLAQEKLAHCEILVVPPGGPRTKPNALTYALSFVRAEYVVVFDAEDRPERDQLRKAVAAFRERPSLGCVQARLAPDNAESWFSRMFILEYAANFEIFLPALASFGVPLPLGGTSNHFPRAVLEKVAAPGIPTTSPRMRTSAFAWPASAIEPRPSCSRTYEEAPVTFRQWLPQRRRWIKGWIRPVKGARYRNGANVPLQHLRPVVVKAVATRSQQLRSLEPDICITAKSSTNVDHLRIIYRTRSYGMAN